MNAYEKMREALLEITRQLEPIVKYMHPNKAEHIGLTTVFAASEPIYKIAKSALAVPPRNCDVGTTEGQTARYNKFCDKNKTTERSCGDCPAYSAYAILKKDCRLAWAQMPYEEGGEE